MPAPFVRASFVRGCLTIIRIICTQVYLWLLVHAAAVFSVPVKRYETKSWSKIMILDISYSSLCGIDIMTEVCIHVIVGVLLCTLYYCWRRNRNHGPILINYRVYVFFAPYLISFLIFWVITTAIMSFGLYTVIYYTVNENMWVLMGQFVIGIIFKILIMSSYCSTCVHCYKKLKIFTTDTEEQRRDLTRLQSFGDLLTMFFNT
ncbi:hypothetical protein KR074_005654 [Drosophila pseudoananassae]|nr:hypothetical protein KR074_005654 [Drosophila pseudoananassae]